VIKKIAQTPNGMPPLLFIHGAWHAAWYWDVHFLDFFQQAGFDAYALSFRQHGHSEGNEKLNSLSIQDYVADVRQVVEEIGEDLILIGHSMGGFVLQNYLSLYACKAAVLMATAPYYGAWNTSINFLRSFPFAFFKGLLTLNLFQVVNTLQKAKWAFYEDQIDTEQLKQYTNQLTGESFRAYLGMLFPSIKIKHHLAIPMLVLAGGKDRIFSLKENIKTAQHYQADFKEFPQATHNLMLGSYWEEIAQYLLNWIKTKVK